MPVTIPLRSTPSYTFLSSIENVTYSFKVRFNDREQSWRLDIRESNGTPIVQGLKLLPNQNLTRGYKDSRLPSGNFYIIDSFGKVTKPTFESLGDRHRLIYFSEEEENELRQTV